MSTNTPLPWDAPFEHLATPRQNPDHSWELPHVRDFSVAPHLPKKESWQTRVVRPQQVTGGWFYVMPLWRFGPAGFLFAHTCIAFTFNDAPPLVYSLEVRLHEGESFNPFGRQELIHLFTTNEDMLHFRRVKRGKPMDCYPLALAREEISNMLIACLTSASESAHEKTPNHYHILDNHCTNALFSTMNTALKKPIPSHPFWHLTTFSPQLLARNGVIDITAREII